MTWIRKKYTKTYLVEADQNTELGGYTISLIGGRNAQAPTATITLFDMNQDNQLRTDMGLY